MQHDPKYRFPWRTGNRFTLLCDGDRFFPRMLEAIASARRYILLEMYLFESGCVADRFIEALDRATRRGVSVCLLLDGFGAHGLRPRDRDRLAAAGVEIRDYNPLFSGPLRRNLYRDHRKLLLVDGTVAFTGGVGLTDDFDPSVRHTRHWHETVIEIRGPCVRDWQALFADTWRRWGDSPLALPMPDAAPEPAGLPGRVVIAEPGRPELKRSFLKRIRAAERRVWMATAYFVPSWKVRRALRHAARQGRDVRLLLPGPLTDHPAVRHAGRRFYARLLRHGVRIFEYQPSFLHAKLVLCDDWISLGSCNLDRWNLRWNLDANQEIGGAPFAAGVQAMFERDFANSEEIHYATWRRRSWRSRLLEWFWGRVDIWLDRYR